MARDPRDFLFFESGDFRLAAGGRPARVVALAVAIIVAIIVAVAALPLVGRLLWLLMDFP